MRNSQRGIGMLPAMVLIALVIFLGTIAVKLFPIYIDHWTLKDVISDVVEESNGDTTPAQIKSKLESRFVTNRIETISIRDITIKLERDSTTIDANYEKRTPLIFNVDGVVKFEDLFFEIPRGS